MQSIVNVDCDTTTTTKQEGTESSANYWDCDCGAVEMDNSTSTYRLAWKNHLPNYVYQFQRYFNHQCLTDVTLACEGQSIKCHKLILSTSSSYFMKLLAENSCDHPIIILHGLKFSHVKHLLSYMYKGEVKVSEKELPAVLKAAETLKIKGLCPSEDEEENIETNLSPPPCRGNTSRNPNSLLLPPPQSPPLSNDLRHEVGNGAMSPPLHMDQQQGLLPLQNPSSPNTMPVNYNNLLNLNNANSNLPFWMSSIFKMLPGPGPAQGTVPTKSRRRRSNPKRSSSPYSKLGGVISTTSQQNILNALGSDFANSQPVRTPVSFSSSAPSGKSVEAVIQDILTNMKKNSPTKAIEIATDTIGSPNKEGNENGVMTISKAMDTPSPPPNAFCSDSGGGSPPKSDDSSSSGSSPNGISKSELKRYKRYNHDDLIKAIELVREKGISCLQAAQQFNIPSRTLYERVKRLSQGHIYESNRKSPTTRKTPDLVAYLSGISHEDLVKMLHSQFQSSTQPCSLPLIQTAEK